MRSGYCRILSPFRVLDVQVIAFLSHVSADGLADTSMPVIRMFPINEVLETKNDFSDVSVN